MKIVEIKMKKKRIWKLKKARSHFHKRISKPYFFKRTPKIFYTGSKNCGRRRSIGFYPENQLKPLNSKIFENR